MNIPVKLSVSSILLAGILTGCSQQQIHPLYMDNDIHKSPQINTGQAKHTPKTLHKKKSSQKKTQTKRTNSKHNIGMPPAKPGQCYAKARKPATYKTLTKKVLIKKATSRRVLVRGPQYRWVNKKILVRPVSYTQRVIPAVYKTVTKRVMVKPSYLTWRKGKGLITKIDHATGEILCRVKIPAVYKNIKRKVLVRAAQTIKTPHPAVYKTVKNKELVSPAQYKTVRTPARYTNKRYRVKTASARYIWRQVVCKTNAAKSHKRKQAKIKIHKAKTYTKKYAQKHHKMRTKPRPRVVKKAYYRKASYSRKVASTQRVRVHKKQVVKKIVRKAHYTKTVAPRKAKINRYRPSTVKKVYTPSRPKTRTIRARVKRVPVRVTKRATQVRRPAPARVIKRTNRVNKPKVRLTKQNAILRIQTALTQRGFSTGGIDGKLGPATVSALTAFQRQHGLKTGRLTRETLHALGLI